MSLRAHARPLIFSVRKYPRGGSKGGQTAPPLPPQAAWRNPHFSGINPLGENRSTKSSTTPIVSSRMCWAESCRWDFNQ